MPPRSASKKKITRTATTRSENVISHVDLISSYTSRLNVIIEDEKLKDERKRDLEAELYKEKLQQADFIANVSYGHELQLLYDRYSKDHDSVAAEFQKEDEEVFGEEEEHKTMVDLNEIEAQMLEQQISAAQSRVDSLETYLAQMRTRYEGVKKDADDQANASTEHKAHYQTLKAEFESAHSSRPSKQKQRKADKEIAKLVSEAQRLREEHTKLMKELHAKEGEAIGKIEAEFQKKLSEHDQDLRDQFSNEELSAIDKHMKNQRALKLQEKQLEAKMKKEMEQLEQDLRAQLKKFRLNQARMQSSIEDLQQRQVELVTEKDVFKAHMKHVKDLNADKYRKASSLRRDAEKLKAELESLKERTIRSQTAYKAAAKKFSMVVEQNQKMTEAVQNYNLLVTRAETELEFSPPSKRIRMHKEGTLE